MRAAIGRVHASGVGVIDLNDPRKMDDRYLGDLGREFRRGKGEQPVPLPNRGVQRHVERHALPVHKNRPSYPRWLYVVLSRHGNITKRLPIRKRSNCAEQKKGTKSVYLLGRS